MASSIGITASIQRARSCTSQHITNTPSTQSRSARSLRATKVVTPNVEGLKLSEKQEVFPSVPSDNPEHGFQNSEKSDEKPSSPRFHDERWKNGTWDLNMFVKQGRMDWDAVIVAGRAAMVGFFMAYIVDALTGVGVVGQTGNFICKAALFFTIIGVLVFRRKEDVENIRKLADEATFYDKQWQASWQDAHEGQSTRYSLVKGERIVRSVLTMQLGAARTEAPTATSYDVDSTTWADLRRAPSRVQWRCGKSEIVRKSKVEAKAGNASANLFSRLD
ncbi:hypothetical protein PHJA_000847800 [Phtheirospermum japonicum]|uniref:Uncharacterized protein n=1 Tax=Phtheirospermum japonicum TaxID=374723 RepID=A0A830BHI7_9LAMI|nr:hypothetical protein PHJA_000847800 [Phtheirospermum japonicum]